MKGKWGIGPGDDWPGWWEQDRLDRSVAPATQVPDDKTEPETLLTDRRGRPLLVRQPRRVGFDPRRATP